MSPLEQIIDGLTRAIRACHIDRLTRGSCTNELGFMLNDLRTTRSASPTIAPNRRLPSSRLPTTASMYTPIWIPSRPARANTGKNLEAYTRRFFLQEGTEA